MANQWFVARNEKTFGPYTLAQMTQLASNGKLRPVDAVRRDGDTEWKPASQFPELLPPPPLPLPDPPEAVEWHFITAGKKAAPVTWTQLRQLAASNQLQLTDMVWKNGMPNWAMASTIIDLFPKTPAQATPPPLPPSSPPPSLPQDATPKASAFEGFTKLTDTLHKLIEISTFIKSVVLALFGGMIGDFLRPIGPINFSIFLISSITAIALIVLFIKRPSTLTYSLGGTCVLSIVVSLGFGAWWGLAYATDSRARGFLAENVPFVGQIQTSVIRGDSVVTERPVEGEKLIKDVQQHIEVEKDARKLLQFAFEGYPGNVIKAEALGSPKRKKSAEDTYTYDLRLSVDLEQYDKITKARILPILEKVALKRGEFFLTSENSDSASMKNTLEVFPPLTPPIDAFADRVSYSNVRRFLLRDDTTKYTVSGMGADKATEMVVRVNTARSGSNDKTTWKWFLVPNTDLVGHQQKVTVTVNISFQDKTKAEITRDQITLNTELFSPVPGLDFPGEPHHGTVQLSPFVIDSNGYYCPSVSIQTTIRLTPSELERLASIRCSVTSVSNSPQAPGQDK